MSVAEAAAAIGIGKHVLLAAERGSQPHPSNAAAIANFYGLDVIVQWPDEVAA